ECLDESSVREEVEALLAEDSSPRIDAPTRGLANRVDLQAEMPLPALPERIGRYRVIRECGHGGMGTVYEAQQDYPERRVALKMIRPGMMSRNLMKRFRYETEFLGRLQHPGVAQIFDAGVSNIGAGEQPYFVMEFINGSPLLEHLRQRGLDTNARLMLFVMICDAVQHAHQRGIIHRDLKPENILVVPAENDSGSGTGHYASLVGQPKVLDFGIAKATDADVQATIQTDAGALVGTLQYMSPEQATGNSDHLDIRSDIYALGVILFEMLSDKTPYDLAGKNIAESVRVIREQDPSRLSSVDSRFRGDLETIVGKCLEKEPERRYASASDLAGDIRRHLQDEPITARPPSTWYQLRKFSRRNRQLVYGVIATVLALAIGLIGTAIYALRASENAQRAGRSESVALAEAYRANLSAAINLVRTDPITARDYLDRVPQEQRGWEWRHAQSQIDQYDFIYEAPVAAVGELVVVSDGSKVVSVLEDHRIAIWDTESTALRQLLPGDHEISTIAAPRTSDDRLAIGTVDGRVLTWNLTDDKPLEIFRTRDGERIRDLSWSRNGEWLAATAYAVDSSPWPHSYFNARVVLFKNGSLHHEFKLGNNKHLPGLAFNHDGSKLAIILVTSRYIPGTLSIIDIETLSIERSLQIADYPLSVTYSDDGEQIYVGTDQRTIVPVDSTSLRQLGRITGHVHRVSDVEFQPHGDLVASSSLDKTIRLWNGKAGKSMAVINTNGTSEVTDIVFNKDGSRLLYNLDGRIYSWSLLADSSVVLRKHKTYVYYVAWSDNGLWLASAALNEPDACIWEANTGELIRNYEYPAACFGIQFLDNGTGLLSGNTILDTTTGQIKARGEDVVLGRQFSRLFSVDDSGRRFAKVQETQGMQNITVYDLPDQRRFTGWTGAPEWELARFDGTYDTLSLSHDGKILAATRMYESEIVVWDVEHRQQLATLIGHTSSVYTLDFSPDGSRLASGSNDNSIRIWDTTTWQQVADLRGHEQYVMNVAFSPDGTRLASASGDHTVRIWDTIPRFERARQARDMAERMDRLRPRIQSLVDELGETRNVTKELLYYFK
ncbi:MAG: protein kinase domain-containing protein, partial [Phycisphaerae bacterium]